MDGTTEFIIIGPLLTSLQNMYYLGKECKLQIKASLILSNLTVWPKKYCKVWQAGGAMCASHGGVRNAATPAHLTGHSCRGTVHKEGKQVPLRGGGEKGPKKWEILWFPSYPAAISDKHFSLPTYMKSGFSPK